MPYVIEGTPVSDHGLKLDYDPPLAMDLVRVINHGATESDPSRQPGCWDVPLTPTVIDTFPKRLRFQNWEPGVHGELRDWLQMGFTSAPIVSQRVVDLITRLEPNIHTFVPIELWQEGAISKTGLYHILIVTQRIQAIDGSASRLRSSLGIKGQISDLDKIKLIATAIEGRHLWRGIYGSIFKYFISDQFHNELLTHKITGWFTWPRLEMVGYPN